MNMRCNIDRGQLVVRILYAALLFIGISLRLIKFVSVPARIIVGVLQTIIYIGLITSWGVSVHRRVVQPAVRSLLLLTCALMDLWFVLRGVKYYFVPYFGGNPDVSRYLWYSYYIPLLFIPAVLLLISFSVRQPESYRLQKKAYCSLFGVSLIAFISVITNDLHQLVFIFPKTIAVFTDSEYSYGALYYLCFLWIVGCILTSLVIMIKKCRLPRRKLILCLPFAPLLCTGFYIFTYITRNMTPYIDITVVMNFSLVAVLEMAISVGLIQTNTGYVQLLMASDLSAYISNTDFEPIFKSDKVREIDKDTLERAVEYGSVTVDGMRVSAYPINGGFAFWQEDMTELLEITEELEELRVELEEQYSVTQEEYLTSHKRQSLVEKNRLYNSMQTETSEKITSLDLLIDRLDKSENDTEIRRLTAETAVLCAYLKRRNNLLFISEGDGIIRGVELAYCIRESLNNLRLCGAVVDMQAELKNPMSFENITKLYDVFEAAIETALHNTSELFVTIYEKDKTVVLRMNLVCSEDMTALADIGFTVEAEGTDEWVLKYVLTEGDKTI